jgi:hypothetical protein
VSPTPSKITPSVSGQSAASSFRFNPRLLTIAFYSIIAIMVVIVSILIFLRKRPR